MQGLGIAILTYCDVLPQFAAGSLEPIELQDASMEDLSIWAITPTRRCTPARMKVFLDALQARLDSAM